MQGRQTSRSSSRRVIKHTNNTQQGNYKTELLKYTVVGVWGCRSARLPGSKQTMFGRSLLTNSKGRETSGGERRKEFISVRPTPRREWTSSSKTISKVLKIHSGSIRKTWDAGGWVCASESQVDHSLGVWSVGACRLREVLMGEQVIPIPTRGCWAAGSHVQVKR